MRRTRKSIAIIVSMALMSTTYVNSTWGTSSIVKASNTQLETLETVSNTEFEPEIGTYRLLPKNPSADNGYYTYEWVNENGEALSAADTYDKTEATGQTRSAYGLRKTVIPESYDLRDYDRVTSVKNQGKEGACWTFSALASLESNMLTQGISNYQTMVDEDGNPDGSERHLAYFTKNRDINGDMIKTDSEDVFSSGGNWNFAMGTLARGSGIEREDHAEYAPAGSSNQPVEEEHEYHRYANVRNSIRYGYDQETIKQAIMEKGAVTSAYYSSSDYYYYKEAAEIGIPYFHSNADEDQYSNHAITIAGWDDNYPKENFAKSKGAVADDIIPKQDGAWLVKNSWGENWGEKSENNYVNQEGYFWISYEENSLQEFAMYEAGKTDSYDKNYGYDGVGSYQLVYYVSDSITGANVFTLPTVEELCSVAFYSNNEHLKYTIRIYDDVVAAPDTGTAVYSQSGQLDHPGYYTIDLNTPLMLEGKIAVAVTFDVPEEYQETEPQGYLPVEGTGMDAGAGNTIICSSQQGESYYYTGRRWKDASTEFNNVCIKAFTKEIIQEEWKDRLETTIREANAMIEDEYYVVGFQMTDIFREFLDAKKQGESVLDQGQDSLYQEAYLDLMQKYAQVVEHYITIATEEELRQIATAVNNGTADYSDTYVVLMQDIDMTGSEPWVPIGNLLYGPDIRVFQGTFDGDGHTITNMNLVEYVPENASNQKYVQTGLFGVLGNKGTVCNLNIEGIAFVAETTHESPRCGGVAGMNFGTIERCGVKGTVTSSGAGNKIVLGGLVGQNMGLIQQCYTVGSFEGNGYYVGGITAWNDSEGDDWSMGIIRNCYSMAKMGMNLDDNGAVASMVTHNGGSMADDYYLKNSQWDCVYWQQGTSTNLVEMSQNKFTSGEAAYQMNQDMEIPGWSQDFEKGYPVPVSKLHGATYSFALSDRENILASDNEFATRTYANAGEIITLTAKEEMQDYIVGIQFNSEADNSLKVNDKGQYIMPEHNVDDLQVIRIRKGSLNGDDKVTAVDALLTLKEISRNDGNHDCYFVAAQNEKTEDISVKDVLRILHMVTNE